VDLDGFIVTAGIDADGTIALMDVWQCDEVGPRGLFIPRSESSGLKRADIEVPLYCGDATHPDFVEIEVQVWGPLTLEAFNSVGTLLDTATAAATSAPQSLYLFGNRIASIEFEGAEICLLGICYECDAPELPPPVTEAPESEDAENDRVPDGKEE